MLDTTVNYSAHVKFVTKWLEKLEAEEKKAAEPQAPAAATPEVTTPNAAIPEGKAVGEAGKAAEVTPA